MLLLGEASYSIYLLQPFFLSLFRNGAADNPTIAAFKLAMAFGLTALISIGIYGYFEAPARRAVRRLLNPRVQRSTISELPVPAVDPAFRPALTGTSA